MAPCRARCHVYLRKLVYAGEAKTRLVFLCTAYRGEQRRRRSRRGWTEGLPPQLTSLYFDYLPLKFTVSLTAVLRTVLPATQGQMGFPLVTV